MRTIFALLVFISLYALRWGSMASPLPKNWQNDDQIGYTTTVLNIPESMDSKTVVRSGIWYISLKGYSEIIPGSVVRFVGRVEPEYVFGKVTKVSMMNPTVVIVGSNTSCIKCRLLITLASWRKSWIAILQKTLPEPMASLSAGILLGVKTQMPEDFYQSLINTGTLHIIAASGYNVTIVVSVIMNVATTIVGKGTAIWIGVIGILLYVLIAGGSASIVRAGIMGTLTLIAYHFGRPTEARRLLWVTGAIMLTQNPLMIFDVGFQLSFGATVGLLYLGKWVEKAGDWLFKIMRLRSGLTSFLSEYLYPTLAATITTLPIIIFHFGRVSYISPLVNILILPLVPLVMGMTSVVIGLGVISETLGQIIAWLLYAPLAWIVYVIRLFGGT